MGIRKISAVMGLFSILAILVHIAYNGGEPRTRLDKEGEYESYYPEAAVAQGRTLLGDL